MAQVIDIKAGENKTVSLSPAPILPKMSFPVSNQTGLDLKVIIDGKNIRIEKAEG